MIKTKVNSKYLPSFFIVYSINPAIIPAITENTGFSLPLFSL